MTGPRSRLGGEGATHSPRGAPRMGPPDGDSKGKINKLAPVVAAAAQQVLRAMSVLSVDGCYLELSSR